MQTLLFERAHERGDRGQALAQVVGVVGVRVADAHAVRLLEGVTGRDEGTRGLDHVCAEVVGVDVVVVVHEGGGAGLGPHERETRLGVDPLLKDVQILANDAVAAGQDRVAVRQGVRGNLLVEQPAADEVVVAVAQQVMAQLRVLRDAPPQADSRHGPYLGHGAHHDGLVVQVDGRGRERVAVLHEQAVHLVEHEPRVVPARDVHDAANLLLGKQRARGVVRVVDADDLDVVAAQGVESLGVHVVVLLLVQVQNAHVGAAHLGNGVELLVGGHDGNDVVAQLAQGREYQVVGAGRAVRGDDVPRLDRLVQAADALEELGAALDVAIRQATLAERVQELVARLGAGLGRALAQLEHLVEGHGVRTGLGHVVTALRLPRVHPLLDLEVLDLHFCLRMWGLAPYAGASARVPSRMWVALLARYSSTTVPMARSTARS